jgi:hypothetical protein
MYGSLGSCMDSLPTQYARKHTNISSSSRGRHPRKYHPAEHLTIISKTHGSIRNEDRKKKAGTQSRGTPKCTSIIKCLKSVKTRTLLYSGGFVRVLVGIV